MCLGKISSIRKNSFFRFFVSFIILFKKKNVEGGPGVEISIIKKI